MILELTTKVPSIEGVVIKQAGGEKKKYKSVQEANERAYWKLIGPPVNDGLNWVWFLKDE